MLSNTTYTRRWTIVAGLLLMACLWVGGQISFPSHTSTAYGQEEAKPAEGEKPADEAKPAEGGKPAESKAKAEPENALIWIIRMSGLIGAVLLCLSIYFVATIIKLFFEFRSDVAAPPDLVEKCEQLIKARDYQTMYRTLKEDNSFYAIVLSAGIQEIPNGLAEARDAMDRTGETLVVDMERKISMLAVLGSLGPMIGLLGTLKGMISSFSAISSGDHVEPQKVAEGISEALLLTMEGVGLSVPAIFFFAFFKNRMTTISAYTMLMADEFIRRMHASAKAGRTTTPSAPA